jgi:sulfotransferase family protein
MWNYAKDKGGIYDLEPEELKRRDAYRSGSPVALAEGLFTRERLTSLASDWSSGVGRAIEDGPALLGDNYTEVRYEDLLEQPLEEVRRLLEFLGAGADERTVERLVEKSGFERKSDRERGQEDSSSRLRKGIAGDWKNVFTAEDKRIFKEVAGDLLIRLGYEKDSNW